MNKFALISSICVALVSGISGYAVATWRAQTTFDKLLVIDQGANVVEMVNTLEMLDDNKRAQLEKLYARKVSRSLRLYHSLVGRNCSDAVNETVLTYVSDIGVNDPRFEYWSGLTDSLIECTTE